MENTQPWPEGGMTGAVKLEASPVNEFIIKKALDQVPSRNFLPCTHIIPAISKEQLSDIEFVKTAVLLCGTLYRASLRYSTTGKSVSATCLRSSPYNWASRSLAIAGISI
jgi:hypothetical protein